MRIITSEEVANITQLWEPVHIINLEDKTVVGSVPRDLVAPNHMHAFSTNNRQMLTTLFQQAYDAGCRHIGFVSPDYLYDTMFNSALDVAEDRGGDWQVSPVEQTDYQDLINQARLKILAESAAAAEDEKILADVEGMEKQICDAMGLTTDKIVDLFMMDEQTVDDLQKTYTRVMAEIESEISTDADANPPAENV